MMITGLQNINQELAEYSDKVIQEKVNNLFSAYREYYENVSPTSDVLLNLEVEGKFIVDNNELFKLSTVITEQGYNLVVQTMA